MPMATIQIQNKPFVCGVCVCVVVCVSKNVNGLSDQSAEVC